MSRLIIALCVGAVAFGSVSALADDSDMKPLTKAQTDAARNERNAAKAKFAAMTPAEQDAVRKAARAKKQADLSMMEAVALEGQNSSATSPARAEAKASVDASKTQPAPTATEKQQMGTTMDKKASSGQ